MVQTVLDEEGLLRVLLSFLFFGSSTRLKTSLLLLLGLGAVLVEELEKLRGGVLVESVGELRNSRGNLEALVQDDLLALKADVLRPLDEASQVGLVLYVLA